MVLINYLQVVHNQPVSTMSELIGKRLWTLPCQAFDQAGLYQSTIVRSSRDSLPLATLAISNEMNVSWSSAYNLSTDVTSILPCESGNHLTVHFTQPMCAGYEDKVMTII